MAANRLEDIPCPLDRRKPGYFMKGVATRSVPSDELCVNSGYVLERVISLGVGHVDRLPWRQDEDHVVKGIRAIQGVKFFTGQRRRILQHGEGLQDAAVEEHPMTSLPVLGVFAVSRRKVS